MGTGGIDGSAMVKAFMVCLISLSFLAQYCALLRMCDKAGTELKDCRVPAGFAGVGLENEDSTWAMMYACVYAIISCISLMGCFMIACGHSGAGCAKVYAFLLVVATAALTGMDFWVVSAIVKSADDNSAVNDDARNYEGFRVSTGWFLELMVYLNAAYDAWDRDDE